MDPDWKAWTTALLTDLTEENMYGNRFLDFPHFISSILPHWINHPDHPFPVPPPPPPAPTYVPYPTVPTPPPVTPFLTPVSLHAPPPPSVPLPSYSPIPFYHPPFQGTWEPVPTESETFLQPLYNDHRWVLDSISHAEYYYFPNYAHLPIYPSSPSLSPLPTVLPNTPRTSIQIKQEPVSSLDTSTELECDEIADYVLV